MNAPALSIIDTLDDHALIAPWFVGPSWNAWRVILKAAFAIPLDDREMETFHALAGDRAPPERQVKELWVIAGRRAGFGHADRLRPGERALVLNLATDRDQAKICLNYVRLQLRRAGEAQEYGRCGGFRKRPTVYSKSSLFCRSRS